MQISLNNFLKKVDNYYIKHAVNIADFANFLSALKKHIAQLEVAQGGEFEEHLKNIFKDILNESIYTRNPLNTKDRIDCAIYNDNHSVAAILEFKTPRNTNEMVSVDNLHKKALFEAIYYLHMERLNGNINVKNIILTDTKQFFFFDVGQFIDKKIERLCREYNEGKTNLAGTGDIYNQIANIIAGRDFEYAYFDLYKTFNIIKNTDLAAIDRENTHIKNLVKFYKIFHPNFMLREFKSNDANQLNQKFYTELLYILGLKETDDKKIVVSDVKNTFMAEVIEKLAEEKGVFNKEERISIALELVITWLNRILFLKLFEGQLVAFNGNDRNFAFLSGNKLTDFDDINTLFFSVLGRPISERREDNQFPNIPYLNSSLFEVSEIEQKYFLISSMRDQLDVELYKSSVLRKGNKKITSLNLLKYLLDFLDAFDFASENTDDELREQSKDIINSAVLGLIFEKLNGYKDGSYFTPSTITEYMAKETIDRTVIQKFNSAFNINCEKIEDLKNWLSDKNYTSSSLHEFNAIVNSLKICDPAVGSGHFPVSVLNYIIYLKSYLRILWDGTSRVSEQIDVVNDALLITNAASGAVIKYERTDLTTHNIQQTIFNEKRTIIENCLFAVDINPKSVQICRLRLWIELLKNTYYIGNTNEMQILPNIDINVKCGNSLISKYKPVIGKSISDNTDVDGRTKFGKQIAEYKKLVSDYKSAEGKENKRAINEALRIIKSQITSAVQLRLEMDVEDKKANKQILEENIYRDSMEWSIEFPEVLDNEGRFLGFDVVIGNPPYIDSEHMIIDMPEHRDFYKQAYLSTQGNWDLFVPFVEMGFNISKPLGLLAYIIPNKIISQDYAAALRSIIMHKSLIEIRDYSRINVFKTADVYPVTIIVENSSVCNTSKMTTMSDELEIKQTNKIKCSDLSESSWDVFFLDEYISSIIKKINANKQILGSLIIFENPCTVDEAYKIKTHLKDDDNLVNSHKFINSGTIDKYSALWGIRPTRYIKQQYLFPTIYDSDINAINSRRLKQSNSAKIIVANMTGDIEAYLDMDSKFIAGKSTIIALGDNKELKLATALLNSSLVSFWFKATYHSSKMSGEALSINSSKLTTIPIPSFTNAQQVALVDLVDKILSIKSVNQSSDITEQENEINAVIYDLYSLTPDEIAIIEGK